MLRTLLLITLLIPALCFGQLFGKAAEDRRAKRKTAWLISHDKLAGACANAYPILDSNGKLDTLYIPNDSSMNLRFQLDSLVDQLQQDSLRLQTFLNSQDYLNLVYRSYTDTVFKDNSYQYQKELFRLTNEVRFLRDNYKPCDSSKVITNTIYRVDVAKEQQLKNQIVDKENVISAKDILLIDYQNKLSLSNKWKLYFFILAGSILSLYLLRAAITKKFL